MRRLLANFDQFSFWIGFLAGILFWWILARLVPYLKTLFENLKAWQAERSQSRRLGVEFHFRNDVLRYVQKLHTASSLFSLEEIAIAPTVLAPPPETRPGEESPQNGATDPLIPYLPDYPEFGSHFGAPRLSLFQTLSKGANLALMGEAGSGKTFALAYTAMQIAQLTPEAGAMADYVPVYLHAADLSLPLSEGTEPVQEIVRVVFNNGVLSRKTTPQFSQLMASVFEEGRVLLLLDGLDELSPDWIGRTTRFLEIVMESYPETRVIAAVSPDYYGPITTLGLVPVVLATWNEHERSSFYKRWGDLWEKHIQSEIWDDGPPGQVESGMLQNWIQSENNSQTPLEITLRAWAIYAGDLIGPHNRDAIQAYIARLAVDPGAAETALQRIATQMVLSQTPVAHFYAASNWSLGRLEAFTEEELEAQALAAKEDAEKEEPESEVTPGKITMRTLQSLIEAGLVVRRLNNRVTLAQPALVGYFAAGGLDTGAGVGLLMDQPDWSGKMVTLHHLAERIDMGQVVDSLAKQGDFHRGVMKSGRWLRNSTPGSATRIQIMRKMVGIVQDGMQPRSVRTRAMSALIFSGDKSIPALCQKLLRHEDPVIRGLAAMGLGITGDMRFENELAGMVSDGTLEVRAAACLGLAALGTRSAIDVVASVMLEADEDTQRAAAEALSTDPGEGHGVLLEAAEMDDLLVRRAAIYGLERMDPQVAYPVLQNLQLSDSQWIVRNVATEVIELIDRGSPRVPRPLPALDSESWLIEFAGAGGEGLPPGDAARDVLLKVLETGDAEQIMAALDYLRRDAAAVFYLATVPLLDHPQPEVREAAHNTIWHMQSAGLPGGQAKPLDFETRPAGQVLVP